MTVNNAEQHVLKVYDPKVVNTQPSTEKALLDIYYDHTDILFQYVRENTAAFLDPITNEIRALLGHLAEYRISDQRSTKRDLDKAYGHLRRINLDSLKLICDEYDRRFSIIQESQARYDLRNMKDDYMKRFGEMYFKAKTLYIEAQKQERLGCDSHTHNVIELYYNAAKEYILLKCYYEQYRSKINKIKAKNILKNIFFGALAIFGILSTILKFLLENS